MLYWHTRSYAHKHTPVCKGANNTPKDAASRSVNTIIEQYTLTWTSIRFAEALAEVIEVLLYIRLRTAAMPSPPQTVDASTRSVLP